MRPIILEGQSLFDLAMQACGTVESVFDIAGLNALSITDFLIPGLGLSIPDPTDKPVSEYYRLKGLKPATDTTFEQRTGDVDGWDLEIQKAVEPKNSLVLLEGQSLFDLAMQACGTVESVFDIASLNALSITDFLIPGLALSIPDPTDKPVAEYYRLKGLKPATDATTAAMDELRNEGIDYWALEVDFVVQ